MLSKKEREYLEGKFQPKKKSYKWRLDYRIRKKTSNALDDLLLVFKKMSFKRLKIKRRDYIEKVVPTLTSIYQAASRERFYQEILWEYLAIALRVAGKRFDWKKLFEDKDYRENLMSWVVEHEKKTGKKYYQPRTLEEIDNLCARLFKNEQNVEAIKHLKQPEPHTLFVKDNDGEDWMISIVKLHGV
ncbi:hypothetical protein KAU85_01415 [Candidatus Bathyarchaeota archaeon]|nr:hypothetical protein [Candidatus Bathyarchaeota archaeon]MCK4482757.1 hypothetical protein [Candidatus Bathyarchaeota archaeon]